MSARHLEWQICQSARPKQILPVLRKIINKDIYTMYNVQMNDYYNTNKSDKWPSLNYLLYLSKQISG